MTTPPNPHTCTTSLHSAQPSCPAARRSRRARRLLAVSGLAAAALGMTGCETDSFLDPSVIGRWENTPVTMPILDRLSSIEEEPKDLVRAEPIQPADLIPDVDQYRFGPGDVIEVLIRDFTQPGQEDKFQPTVDSRGYIFIPRLKPIRVQGRTNTELVTDIQQATVDANLRNVPDAVVSVNILSQRSQTFSVIGAVQQQQEYFIPQPNYRIFQALTAAGGFNETIQSIYVIRQVPLSDEAAGVAPAMDGASRPSTPDAPQPSSGDKKPEDLLNLIDELAKPKTPPPAQPGMIRSTPSRGQPETAPTPPTIDLPDSSPGNTTKPEAPASDWVYRDGRWVRNTAAPAAAPGTRTAAEIVTQRVIEVPVSRLLAGDASVNIVIRPGDVIRVPPPTTGVIYMGGQVSRPGPYGLQGDTKLTLLRGLDSAGGLAQTAIPERTDLTRIVGPGRQATIRLNLRAIAEQTQPDIYLKPDDRIIVGTNFWALPLAVIRGGFRASYGFGFILDRNFSGEVFGPDRSLNR